MGRASRFERRRSQCRFYLGREPLRIDPDAYAFARNSFLLHQFDEIHFQRSVVCAPASVPLPTVYLPGHSSAEHRRRGGGGDSYNIREKKMARNP
ncbi:hypothetical protein Pcinc_007116 [Petrolisthes cinctipes]|uniref:Uncharacterized protein n=1 Tax=Petrolisthes cinctipes TaxID=88211 RepID=A0AAE1L0V4_PETCI|nr:hypothetical protein Pcinc_007116 [Petrolisthes cinctipes]